MDPFSFTTGALQIAAACAQCTITIIKWVGDVRTVDARISSFCDEVAALRTTYEGLERSLASPLIAEAARVASQTPDGAHLWRQIKETLEDSKRTVFRVNEVLNQIGRTSGLARRVRTQLQESLSSGELSRLRQRIQFFNTALALPIQMVCVMLQLEQRGMSSDHQVSLDVKLTSLEKTMREVVHSLARSSRSNTLGGATIIASEPEVLEADDDMNTYVAFAKKFLTTASAAASTRSSLSTVSPAIDADAGLPRRKPSIPDLPLPSSDRERVAGWISSPANDADVGRQDSATTQGRKSGSDRRKNADDSEIEFMRTKRHLTLGQESVEQGNHFRAETHFRKALALMETNDFEDRIALQPAEVVLMLANSCVKQEKLDEAVTLLEPVADMRPDVYPLSSKGPGLEATRPSPSQHRTHRLQALAANHMLGQVFMLKSDFDSAEEHGLKAFSERRKELGSQDEKTLEEALLEFEEAEAASPLGNAPQPQPETVRPEPAQRSSRSGFTQRLRHFGRSSQSTLGQSPTLPDLQRLSISRTANMNDAFQDYNTAQDHTERLRGLSSPSDTSTHERSSSFPDDDSVTTPSSSVLERSSSTRTIEPTFVAIAQLCAERKMDRAVKVALQFLDTYQSKMMIIRKMDLEKNIRRGLGQGLARTGLGYAPLHFFCELKEEHAEEVNLLVKHGVDVNAVAFQAGYTQSNPKDPFTALQQATQRGYSTITALLLACEGIKTDFRDPEGLTPLMVACRKGHYVIVQQLLKFQLPTDFPQIWHGNTLLHDAARRCDPVIIEMLIDHYPDVDARDKFSKTALMHAVIKTDINDSNEKRNRVRGRCRTVQILLEAGADPTLKDNRTGLTVRDYAMQENDNELLALLDHAPRTGVSELVA
ncbi:hypothetical protein LTR10_016803 [Elasticomyces elasticus]|uniref:Fungal N-terminal domain-containing protein n=1 Tax=Exophiala sideris TaxID=1016849 RepID=A0ABR0JMV6_9EURO|nr:hypothetical protein LTR10_016803 [Elasticomyces elasticus]KAK5037806.1 hypothetical protein LTS07_001273 [Exophiala sideris]KAK5043789.1 hypothetical protein LTR13_000143 [Exophiala sideris]KAK5067288.1 hypothetical protein LTR69_001275 [Exophiala sideris]KAK5182621.1 hypothetical protein LTR44_005012 [Eurotiomycetes sp. CCFEE 6388]